MLTLRHVTLRYARVENRHQSSKYRQTDRNQNVHLGSVTVSQAVRCSEPITFETWHVYAPESSNVTLVRNRSLPPICDGVCFTQTHTSADC